MFHKKCWICRKIGHLPEMKKYIDPGYIKCSFEDIKRWGIKYAHEECAKRNFDEWINNIIAIREKRS